MDLKKKKRNDEQKQVESWDGNASMRFYNNNYSATEDPRKNYFPANINITFLTNIDVRRPSDPIWAKYGYSDRSDIIGPGNVNSWSGSGNQASSSETNANSVDWSKVTNTAINVAGWGIGVAALATESPVILGAAGLFTAISLYTTYVDYKAGEISLPHTYANSMAGALNIASIALAKAPYLQAKMAGIALGGLGHSIDTMNFASSFVPKEK